MQEVQDLAFLFVKFHEIPLSRSIQRAKISLNGSTTIWCITHSSQSSSVCKLAEGALVLSRRIISEGVQQYWLQY